MTDQSALHLWAMRLLFLGLSLCLVLFQLLPLETTPRSWAGPDLLMAFSFAWVLRRPEFVPVPIVAMILLLSDFLLGRPPGLWAALTLLAFDNLRARSAQLRDLTFLVEWINVAIAMALVMMCYRLVLGLLLVQEPAFGLMILRLVGTILVYPFAVLVTRYGFGLRKIMLGEVNALGQRQ